MIANGVNKFESIKCLDNFFLLSSLSAAGLTDKGRKRQNNEDDFYMDKETGLFIVSDGMGGAQAGEVASRMVVDYLPFYIISVINSSPPEVVLEDSILAVSNYIRDYTEVRDELNGAGATVVACLIADGKATIGHMGDSRVYLLRGNDFKQITEDHSAVFEMVKAGMLTLSEAKKDPFRNHITRCMGMDDTPFADINSVDLLEGDRFLLCSDGLTGMLSDEVIGEILLREKNLNSACEKLINLANSAGGVDNITAVIVQYGKREEEKSGTVHVIPFEFNKNLRKEEEKPVEGQNHGTDSSEHDKNNFLSNFLERLFP
jgi:protein phosphatase